MKIAIHLLGAISIILGCALSISAKNYTSKAPRPTASDHTWSGYDYNFNLDEGGMLTGKNTFSKVYNTTPPRWFNDSHWGYRKICTTGSETLTITVLPGDFNYIYTLTSNITMWDWDDHNLKWVKRNNQPFNGTRTFKVKDGKVEGSFEFPVSHDAFMDVWMIYGNSTKGIIPDGGKIGGKYYDSQKSTPQIMDNAIIRDGDSIRISAGMYINDVLKIETLAGEKRKEDENGTSVFMAFPVTDSDILGMCGRDAGVGQALEMYAWIGLPDVIYDKYMDPYAPVETILPNGHRQVATLNPNGSKEIMEYWENDGYKYQQNVTTGTKQPIRGEKVSNDTTYIHVIDKYQGFDEKGFKVGGKYRMTYKRDKDDEVTIEWNNYKNDGYYIIHHDGNKYFALDNSDASRHTFSKRSFRSHLSKAEYGVNTIKIVGSDGSVTVAVSNVEMLTDEANRYLSRTNHPYYVNSFKQRYPEEAKGFNPPAIKIIQIGQDGKVKSSISNYSEELNKRKGRDRMKYEEQYKLWRNFKQEINRSGKDPLTELASLIAMELSVPDYDVTKVESKTVGQRTAKLLKKLCDMLKQKNDSKADIKIDNRGQTYQNIFPNDAKRYFTHKNRYLNYKKVEIERVTKQGNTICVYVKTIDTKGKEQVKKLTLEDNVPMDEYTKVWEAVARAM